ncbi:MAG: efflux RND transporter periplasmic adaptor subunit [Acidobacteria bacterium]|nr:efflux RND transporter periplasmic adaptor subunit [Acidobacteriota bacterium]
MTLRSNVTIVAVLAVGAFAASGCSRAAPEAGPSDAAPPPLPKDVQSVASVASPAVRPPEAGGKADRGEDALVAGGRLAVTGEFVPLIRSDLVPRTGGRVARVLVDEGQRVRLGQPLLELETDYLKLDVARAEAERRRAAAAADEARRDFQRKTDLAGRGSVSQAVFLRSKAGAEQAEAALAAAQAALDLAQQRLSDAVLTSPVDGVVATRRTDIGERLGEASVAFVVEQTAPLKLRFRAPERYLAMVRVGQPVAATVDPYPGEAFDGTVSVVGGSVDAASRTFLVEAEFPNRDGRLRPGLFARVELQLGEE